MMFTQQKNQASSEICVSMLITFLLAGILLFNDYGDCGIPIQMWLTVFLGVYVAYSVVHLLNYYYIMKHRRGNFAFTFLDYLVLLFQFGWLVYGNVIFYDKKDMCDEKAYNLWLIMFMLIIIGYCEMCKCCCFSVLFCVLIPLLFVAGRMQQRPDWAPASDGFIGNLVHTRFNVNKNGQDQTTCTICMEEFKDNDEVIPLPCNPKHIFH
jgi:hypothetical protein